MAVPIKLLIAVSRLKHDENVLLRQYSSHHAPTIDISLIDAAIQQAVLDRIKFANDFVVSAENMLAGTPGEMDFRNATSRSYYGIHHALRAVLLFDRNSDSYGHVEAIEDFVALMNKLPALKAKSNTAGITNQTLNDALHRRHLADYHFYGSMEPEEPSIDFSVICPAAVVFAKHVVKKMEEYLQDRIAGKY